jgi:glucose/arabinose dehydrogenase
LVTRRIGRPLLGAFLLCAILTQPAAAVSVPSGFVVENAVPGATFDTPTSIAFLPDGRLLVAEQRGVVRMAANGALLATPVWSATAEVLNDGDRGLLGIAVHPRFFENRYVYFFYAVDPDTNGVDTEVPAFCRLTRYQMRASGDTNTVDPATRAVLIGTNWSSGILSASNSHSSGALRWGADGSLLLSHGDGGGYIGVDAGGQYPSAFGAGRTSSSEDIGAFRAQDITSLCGKVLRINPETGHGYAGNPYADGDLRSVRSRVWAYGFRNPFRFGVRPGTGSADTAAASPGSVYVGDVGWNTFEELAVVRQGGGNFGWPCMEGFAQNSSYQGAAPAHNGCGSVGTATNPAAWESPSLAWHHSNSALGQPPGYTGVAAVGGVFYAGDQYPADYRGRCFYADYGAGWIRVATFGGSDNLITTAGFGTSMDAPVDLVAHPIDHDIHYVSITTGEIRRIRYTGASGGNAPPVANLTASPLAGVVPLPVSFSASGSFEPDGDPLSYSWTFGDGGTSTAQEPVHVYTATGSYNVVLTVSDGRGGTSQAQTLVSVYADANFPTSPVLDTFNRADGAVGAGWSLNGGSLVVAANAMRVASADVSGIWNAAPFGPDQEVFVTLKTLAPGATETDLLLKAQGTIWSAGLIEVWYDAPAQSVRVVTYDAGSNWRQWGVLPNVTLANGDQFGARARANGLVEVFRNQVKLGEVSVTGWPYYNLGGRVGLWFVGALNEVVDDFGGGNWAPNTGVPVVAVTSPNGGENWVGGSSHAITWTATDDVGITGVDISYRDGASAAWTPLAVNVPNTGSFTWFVHNTPTPAARVRVVVRDGAGNVVEDLGNADFVISATPGGVVPTTLRDFQMPGTQPLGVGGFQSHETCYTCHGGYDPAAEPGRNWRGTMMAQAARDPLFYACLTIAEQDAPSSGDLCIRCHSPGAWLAGRSQPTDGSRIDVLDRDGVSCDFCHRLVDPLYQAGVSPAEDEAVLSGLLPSHRPTGYSNGQYVVDPEPRRRGPFTDAVSPHSFLASPFHSSSELCATCHDVSNPVFERTGDFDYAAGPLDAAADSISPISLMPLERTYSEWKNSAFPAGVVAPEFAGNAPGGVVSTCQSCHMRDVTGQGCNMGSAPVRADLPLHDMTGGNAWMGSVIASLYPGETDAAALAEGGARARAMLQKAAQLEMWVTGEGDSSLVSVKITNHTGHKLPTGYPEGRRMWLNVRARDAGGQVVFESCAYDAATGVLTEDPAARVYEAKLGVSPGFGGGIGIAHGPTFHFVLNDTLYKDNRIPPLGFTNAAYAAFGGAPVDPDLPSPRYPDGQNWDLAYYRLPPSAAAVTATLYYQSTSKEYVEFLRDANSTNSSGQVMYDAWVAHGRAAPVAMASDSFSFNLVDVGARVPAVLALRTGSNPFRSRLDLSLALPRPSRVELEILDVAGRVVARVPRGTLPAGEHGLAWDGRDGSGRDVGAGVFWALVRVDEKRLVRRVVRLR